MSRITDSGLDPIQNNTAAAQAANSVGSKKASKTKDPSDQDVRTSGSFALNETNTGSFRPIPGDFPPPQVKSSSPRIPYQLGYSQQNHKSVYPRPPAQHAPDPSLPSNETYQHKSSQNETSHSNLQTVSVQVSPTSISRAQGRSYATTAQYHAVPTCGANTGLIFNSYLPMHGQHKHPGYTVAHTDDPNSSQQLRMPHAHLLQKNPQAYQNTAPQSALSGQQRVYPKPQRHNIQPWYQNPDTLWQQGPQQPQQWRYTVYQQPVCTHHPADIVYSQDPSRLEYPGQGVKVQPPPSRLPRSTKAFWSAQYQNFLQSTNSLFDRLPTLLGRPVDLYHLFYAVTSAGGFRKVSADDDWKMIAEKFGLGHIKDVPMALSTLYQQYLLRFEDFLLKTLGAGAPVPAGRTQPVQMPAREYAQPQYMQVRSTTGGPSLVGLQARVYGGDQDPRQDAHFTQTSRFYSTSRPDTLSHELGNSAPQNQQLCSEFPYSHSQTGRPPVSPAVTLEPPQNMRGMQYPTSQGVYPVHPHAQQPKYYVPQGQATHFQQLRKENSPKSPLATDGTYQKPHPPQPLVQHLVNTRRKTTTTPEFSRSAYAPEGKHVPPGEVSAAPGAGAPASKAAKNDYFIFRPRIYRLDTYGGLDISAIAGVPPAPHISGRAYEGPIDIERVVMSIKSKLDPEIKYALDSLFTLSMDESLEFGLDQFPELFDLLVLIAEGRLFSPKSHNASEISQEFYGIPEEPCQDEGNAGLSEMLTANVIVCGGDSEKEIKKSAAHAGVRKNSSSMQFILLSYSLLLQHENMRSGGVQDIRDDVYEVMCSENRKLTVISAETILRNFSFISLNQRFLGRNKRFRRLLMSMLTAGSLVRNRDNSVSLNRSPGDYHVDNPDPLPKNGCASEIGDKGEAGPCHHSADESLDILVTPEDEEGSLIPETVILSKNRNLLNHPSLSAHIALERRINGLTILSNIGFHYHMRSEVEAYIIWSVIFDFLIGNDLVHSYTALEALTRLTLIYDNAKYFSKLKRMNIIIDRVVSMLPSEPFLSFGVAQLPRSMEMANSTTIRQRSAGSQGVTPDHYTDLKNYPANNIQTSKKGNDSHSKRGEDSDTQDQRDITRIRTFFQPILNKFTQEEISLWEMASMALLHIVLIDEASVKETLASTPRFIQKLMDLINAPLILSLHNISPSLMPTALSLCIRSLRMLLECLKDGTICSLAQVHEQTMLHILWSLRSISEYNLSYGNDAGLQQPHDCALQYESDCSSPFKHMETLVSECLNLLGHLE